MAPFPDSIINTFQDPSRFEELISATKIHVMIKSSQAPPTEFIERYFSVVIELIKVKSYPSFYQSQAYSLYVLLNILIIDMFWTYSSLQLLDANWPLQLFILKYFKNINPYFLAMLPALTLLNYYFFKRNINKIRSRVVYIGTYISLFSFLLFILGLVFGSWLGVGLSVIGFSVFAIAVVIFFLSGGILVSRIFTEKYQSNVLTFLVAITIAQIISLFVIYLSPKPSESYASYTYEVLSREVKQENQKKMGILKNITVGYFPEKIKADAGTIIYGYQAEFECLPRGKVIVTKRVANYYNEEVLLDASKAEIGYFSDVLRIRFRLDNQVIGIDANYSCLTHRDELRRMIESIKLTP